MLEIALSEAFPRLPTDTRSLRYALLRRCMPDVI
jgi:hypothetical protein